MRPIELTMEAFGPYEKKTVVDFRELGKRSFFLIHGATGAGKTTILDAICYAFYGSASVAGRGSDTLRSRQASPDSNTYVRFQFSLGQKVYEIFRNPDYLRRKKYGDGTTLAKSDAELWRIMADGRQSIVTGTKNVTAKMTELLGFASEQFRQVVLLPQGEFRRMLLASSAERQEILETLFKTERFRRIEEMLKNQARDSAARQQEIGREKAILLQDTGADSIVVFQEQNRLRQASLEEASRHTAEKQVQKESAQQAAQQGQHVADLFAAKDTAEKQLKDCRAKLQAVQQYRERLAQADRAASLLDVARQAAEKQQEQQKKQGLWQQALEQENQAALELDESRQRYEQQKAKESEREGLRLQAQKFTEYEQAVQVMEDGEKQASLLQQKVGQVGERKARAQSVVQNQQRCYEEQCRKALRLQHLFAAGQAALLAKDLANGMPCPVCGSFEHPKLALAEEVVPDEAEVRRAQQEQSRLDQARQDAQRQAEKIQAEFARHQAELARTQGSLEEKRSSLPAEYRGVQALRQAMEQNARQLRQLEEAWQQADMDFQQKQRLGAARKAAAASARTAAQESEAAAEAAAKNFAARREAAGFTSFAMYDAALAGKFASEEGREEVRRHIRSFEDSYTAAQAACQKAAAAIEQQSLPDMTALQTAFQAALEAWKESYAEEQRQQTELAGRAQKEKRLLRLQQEEADLMERYQTIGRLAEVANGSNAYNMHFQTYVLRSLLRDVIDAANERLTRMSRGQYQLQLQKEIADRRSSFGLDLDIFDAYTGYERPMATLSGGESFLASLSLALGLADVVTSYAGGIRLDTMFIDEGFGTLDSETLDLAIRALLDLQQGGRLIGIISHVEELRERIDARLEICKGREGSSARFIID